MNQIRCTDVSFLVRREAGPGCLCSRCLLPIFDKLIKIVPITDPALMAEDREWRYHLMCLDKRKANWGESYQKLPF